MAKSAAKRQSPKRTTDNKNQVWYSRWLSQLQLFGRNHWKGTLVILIATLIYFGPIVTRMGSYSAGGDAMFNAWTLSRNHHCLMGDRCPDYTDGNIYFPHQDTMLYSETQTSAGLLTLPIHWFSKNPILAYNLWTIISFFLGGWFMYLLAKYLSRKREFVSILSGLVFAFAPLKIAAIFHLQNLSIFYLPLAVLLTLRFFDSRKRKYLGWLLVVLILQFYASWYNMAFVLMVFGVLLAGYGILKLSSWRSVLLVGATVTVATMATLPLAKEYIRFSKANHAGFSIKDQTLYSSSVADYFIPHENTLIGKLYYGAKPTAQVNAYNLDSYSYHGLTLYLLAAVLLVLAFRWRRQGEDWSRNYKLVLILVAVALVGFIISLGPLLKFKGNFAYGPVIEGFRPVIPMPWMAVLKILPPVSFIRAIGRASILFLFALCCLLALWPVFMERLNWSQRRRYWVYGLLGILLFIELAPVGQVRMNQQPYSYNYQTPAVYEYVKSKPEIDNLIVLAGDHDYPDAPMPIARAEWVLWAGYHNRNIFNGYSGYTPPSYLPDYIEFKDFDSRDVTKMKDIGLRYVIVDKQLSTSKPELIGNVRGQLEPALFEDQRFALFKL